MKLNDIIKDINVVNIIGDANVDISDVDIDSRKVKGGHLFVAIKGTQTDGHQYIDKAIELGAAAVLCEDLPAQRHDGVCYVQVASTEQAVGPVATVFQGDPSSKVKLVGVTGTNGTHLLAVVFQPVVQKGQTGLAAHVAHGQDLYAHLFRLPSEKGYFSILYNTTLHAPLSMDNLLRNASPFRRREK